MSENNEPRDDTETASGMWRETVECEPTYDSPAPSTAWEVKELRERAADADLSRSNAPCMLNAASTIERLEGWKAEQQQALIRFAVIVGGVVPGDGILDTAKNLVEQLSTVTSERDAAVKVIERLPKTADGVPITPGMSVHIHEHVNGNPTTAQVWVNAIRFNAESVETSWGKTLPSRCYSTREAALASLKENR